MALAADGFPKIIISGTGQISALGGDVSGACDIVLAGRRNFALGHEIGGGWVCSKPVFACRMEDDPTARRYRVLNLLGAALKSALADAGLEPRELKNLKVGVAIGSSSPSMLHNISYYTRTPPAGMDESFFYRRHADNNPARWIAEQFGLTGPEITLVNACTGGADAVATGAGWIKAGLCDVAIVGGGDELCLNTYAGFSSLGLLSEEPCKPFDANRSGLNLGEGAGICILEAEGLRSVKPKGALLGAGMACDAHHLTAPEPGGRGIRKAIAKAFAQWGGDASGLAFVKAHGTATFDNDLVEGRVIADLLGGVPFFSLKGYVGHTLGGSGATESVLALEFLRRGAIPASAGFCDPDPSIGASPVTKVSSCGKGVLLALSLGFGGQNAALVIGRES